MDRQTSITRLLGAGFTPDTANHICDVLQIELAVLLLIPADWPADYRAQFQARWKAQLGEWKSGARAFRALEEIQKKGTRWGDLMSGIEQYAASKRVRDGFIQHAATWLNAHGWQDQERARSAFTDSPSLFEIGFSPHRG